ncbi:hypothetical protein JCM3765_007819 [Sporobolomyces pararoseus]
MSSDDPIQLPQIELELDQDESLKVEQHLNSMRKNHRYNPTTKKKKKKDYSNIHEIYQERLKANQDTVDQDWFDPTPGGGGGGVYSTFQSGIPGGGRGSKDRLSEQVKLNVRRVGSKATDTFRKFTNQQQQQTRKSIFSTFTRTGAPKITVENVIEGEGEGQGGIPLQGVMTNSSLNTINLPPFDLSSSSSRSSLSSFTTTPISRSRTPQQQRRPRVVDPLDFEPPERVPTPPPFPSSPLPPPPSSQSRPTSPQSLSPSLYDSTSSNKNTPFHNLISLPPLSETSTTPLTCSPTSSLRNFQISSPTSTSEFPTSNNNSRRRTLTVENDFNPPSRRDTLTRKFQQQQQQQQSRNNNDSSSVTMISHLKNSLNLKQINSNVSTNSSTTSNTNSRPVTPPNFGVGGGNGRPGLLSRSPTEITFGEKQRINKKKAKEELQKLLSKRKKFLFRNNKSQLSVIPDPEQEQENSKEEGEEVVVDGGVGKGIERAILKRLKILGALVQEESKIQTDILWEHQRGLLVFGLPKFSSAALFQFDPTVWTDENLKSSPYTPHDFPCKPYWKWLDQEFMVDIGGDVDEEGWSYAVFFHSKNWRGEPSLFKSFVRRRKWIRTRVYIPLPSTSLSSNNNKSNKRFLAQEDEEEEEEEEPVEVEESYTAINGTKALDQSQDKEQEVEIEEVNDLKSACECLPLTRLEKQSLFYSISKGEGGNYIPPCNPFIPFRIILEHSKHNNNCQQEGGGNKELIWRKGIIEINERRTKEVLKKIARIDRERLKLWKIWLQQPDDTDSLNNNHDEEEEEEFECSEWSEWRIGEKFKDWTEWLEEYGGGEDQDQGQEGRGDLDWKIKEEGEGVVEEEDFADLEGGGGKVDKQSCKRSNRSKQSRRKQTRRRDEQEGDGVGKPDLEDVWDLIESRLDNILSTFDYHLTRLSFLRLLISCHPLSSTPIPTSTSTSNNNDHDNNNRTRTQYIHRHEGWDLPLEERKKLKELEWEKRLKWVLGVKEEIQRMEGGNTEPAIVERKQEEKRGGDVVDRSRSERRNRKGKQKAIYLQSDH